MTLGLMWKAIPFAPEMSGLLEWPPDVFGFADRILDTSEAYRFIVSPPAGVTAPVPDSQEIVSVARAWLAWLDHGRTCPPRLESWWATFLEGADVTLEAIGSGKEWALCEALLAPSCDWRSSDGS